MERFSRAIVKGRHLILVAAVLLLLLSLVGVIATRINYDILSYLPEGLESMVGEQYLENDFNIASTAIVTVEGMESYDVIDMEEEISRIDGVSSAFSVYDVLDQSIPKDMIPQEARSVVYGKNDSTMILIRFDEASASDKTMNAIVEIKKTLRKDCFLGGMSVILEDTKELVNQELPKYVLCAVLFSIVVLFLFLPNTVVPFLFMLGLLFPIAFNFGTNVLMGEISYITEALAAVLQLGVTMDFSIFLLHRYEEEKQDKSNEEAMAVAISKTFSSITASSLTTIAGFLAMCAMSFTLGTDIGIVMAKGVFFGVVSTITILPALLMRFDKVVEKYRHPTLTPKAHRLASVITAHPGVIIAIFVLVLMPFAIGNSKTDVYYTLTDSLPQDMTGITGTHKLGDDFDMPSYHFLVVDDALGNSEMKNLAKDIDKVDGVKNSICLEKFIGGGLPDSIIPQDIKDIFHAGGHRLLIVTTAYSPGTDKMNAQVSAITDILKSYDKTGIITGEGAMTKDLITTTDHDFRMVSLFSILAVFVIIMLTFQSISVPVLLVAAIEGAIYINMGMSYFTGATVAFISSIVIGTIQLGATVDYAILMTTRFHEEQNNGYPPKVAARIAVETCTPSILTSGLTFFAATVGLYFVSRIDLIRGLCLLISRGAIISMLVILLVLPSLLIVLAPVINKTSIRWLNVARADWVVPHADDPHR